MISVVVRFAPSGLRPTSAEPLSAVESLRAAAYQSAPARDRFIAARTLARRTAGALWSVEPGQVIITQHCPNCGAEDHGIPRAQGGGEVGSVSISHAEGAVAIAIGPASDPVGVDVEPLHAVTTGLMLAGRPIDVSGWTVLEAATKAWGFGLTVPLDEIDWTNMETDRLRARFRERPVLEVTRLYLPGFAAAVATRPGTKLDVATVSGP